MIERFHFIYTGKMQIFLFCPWYSQLLNKAFYHRVEIAPPSETPPVSACKPLCARFGDGVVCVPAASP